jgi:hypothetical protein
MLSAAPAGALMGTLIAIPAAIYVWKGIQDLGEGVRHATKSASADTALRILHEHAPSTTVREAKAEGRVTHTITPGVMM